MTPDEHAAEAEKALRWANNVDINEGGAGAQAFADGITQIALVHAVLALRPVTVGAPAMPEMWLDRDGDVWSEIQGCMVMLDREAGEWDRPGLYVRTGVEKNYGPLRPIPTTGVSS